GMGNHGADLKTVADRPRRLAGAGDVERTRWPPPPMRWRSLVSPASQASPAPGTVEWWRDPSRGWPRTDWLSPHAHRRATRAVARCRWPARASGFYAHDGTGEARRWAGALRTGKQQRRDPPCRVAGVEAPGGASIPAAPSSVHPWEH